MNQKKFYFAITGIAVLVYSGILPFDVPLPKCPLHYLTGYLCAGCGTQRAIIALFDGNLIGAFQANVILFPSLLLACFMSFTKDKKWALHKNNTFIFLSLVLLIAYSILRNLSHYPFNLLAPAI